MMRTVALGVLLSAVSALLAGGCAAPVVTVRHVLPAAVPLPPDVEMIRPNAFAVSGAADGEISGFVAKSLDQGLAEIWPGGKAASQIQPARVARVGGKIDVQVKDTRGSRHVRRLEPKTRTLTSHEVPTLIRTAEVRVQFIVTRAAGGEHLVTVEVRRSYDSPADPRVRGPLGLERPDDPQRVPPGEQVLRELLSECVEAFCRMVAPVELVARVPLRPTGSRQGAAGLEAARAGDFQAAIGRLQAAVHAAPNDVNLLFNLAVVCEAGGQYEAALSHYQAVVKQAEGRDPLADEGARRLRRVLRMATPPEH